MQGTSQYTPQDTPIKIEPAGEVKAAVIWLHGLGADGHDFEPIVPQLQLPTELGLRFVFPHAPMQPVTINGGQPMRAWFDIINQDLSQRQDRDGIRRSAEIVDGLIQAELDQGIPSERIILAGFSQGGAIALQAGLRYPQKLGGILALSTLLPMPENVQKEATDQNRDIPIMMMHGLSDPVISVGLARASYGVLQQHDYPCAWREYDMQHAVCAEQLVDISQWFLQMLAAEV